MRLDRSVLAWIGVALVGVVVVVLVLGLSLFPRLNAAQGVLDDGRAAFTSQRVAGDRAAIDMVGNAVTLTDQIASDRGGASAEVPKLVAFVSQKTGLPPAAVLKTLQAKFPHTTALLQALPLSSVASETPALIAFLAKTLKLTPAQVTAALRSNFPHIYQAVSTLPAVTGGWYNVPGTQSLTRFDGAPVRSVPQTTAYFSSDVVPVLERQQSNFQSLDSKGGVGFLDVLLLVIGIIVIVFGGAMAYLASRGPLPRGLATGAWGVVVVVGVAVVGLVLALALFPRLSDGQNLVDDARPAFAKARVDGDRAAINMLSNVVQVADPIMTDRGGAAAEVPQLVGFVSQKTGLKPAAVLAALKTNVPHTTALLQAIPLSSVSSELPGLTSFLATTLKVSPAQLNSALGTNFPHLYKSIQLLPAVTGGWNDVPGTAQLTRFDGSPVRTVPQIRDYFSGDVIPVLESQQSNFTRVDSTWPRLTVFAPLLLVVGIAVILYGLAMLLLTRRQEPAHAGAPVRAT
ncbi:MAG TPA: hypothetical protein VGO94_13480 [Mycobacteriales bacterium]|nr:hypothetical protein [Mycobacteriales bacterium]